MKKINRLLSFTFILFIFSFSLLSAGNKDVLSIGNKNAKITVKVFSSLTCPHCASFHENIFDELKKDYINTGKILFEHHSFPLDLAALNAEKIIRCTNDKEKNFNLLGEIYKKQNKWAVGSDINKINDSIKLIGKNLGLAEEEMNTCLADEVMQDKILNERINAQKKYEINSTPTIIINEEKYEDKHEYKEFKKKIEKLLSYEI